MSVAIKKAVHSALESVTVYQQKVDALKALCANVEDVRGTILPYVASFYAVPLVDGQRKAIGRKVMDSTAEKYITAKQAWMRLSTAIEGNKPKDTVAVPVSKKLVAAGTAMVIEHSMTAAQFNAWVAAVRSSVTFAKG
jgi:hypothetical protein